PLVDVEGFVAGHRLNAGPVEQVGVRERRAVLRQRFEWQAFRRQLAARQEEEKNGDERAAHGVPRGWRLLVGTAPRPAAAPPSAPRRPATPPSSAERSPGWLQGKHNGRGPGAAVR